MSAPETILSICSGVPLNNRYEHTLYFATAADQSAYFGGKVVKTLSAYSYIRRSWDLYVDAVMGDALKWNYLYLRNPQDRKTFYYFITAVEYENEETVKLSLELDVLQTFLFDFSLLPTFIERQHAVSDAVGENTLEEGLETGDFIVNKAEDVKDLNEMAIMVLSTLSLAFSAKDTPVPAFGYDYDGVFSGCQIMAAQFKHYLFVRQALENFNEWGFTDSIVSIWQYPKALLGLADGASWKENPLADYPGDAFNAVYSTKSLTKYITPNYTLEGYTPRNKKLLCYPYRFIYVTNNTGNAATYRWERFDAPGMPAFQIDGALAPDGTVKITPTDYNGAVYNYEEGVTLGNFPTCAWDSDVYKIWLAQNQSQQNLSLVSGGLTVLGGVATALVGVATWNPVLMASGAGAAIGGHASIAQQLAQKTDAAVQPPQARGRHSSTVNVAHGKQTFTIYQKSITAERARIIDDYFTMYGYKQNRVEVPNLRARSRFTYVKTNGCHISAPSCTSEDAATIERIFDKGITWWADHSRVGDYGPDNEILTKEVAE